MEISDFIAARFSGSRRGSRVLLGICGRAGAGKTTLAHALKEDLGGRGITMIDYSGDWRFVLDSKTRRRWLSEKWRVGIEAYLYAMNQFSWWNFQEIHEDLERLLRGESLTIEDAYDRSTGEKNLALNIPRLEHGIVCYENCILGGVELLETINMIVLVNTPDTVCFERMMRKDGQRRTLPEIATRYLITTYSENVFLSLLFDKFSDRIVACDSNGGLSAIPDIDEVSYIPVPVLPHRPERQLKGTVFCDLDGTLVEHVAVPSADGRDIVLLEGTVSKLEEFRAQGYFLILTTSRPHSKIFPVLENLRSMGVEFDQIISDLPVGPRHLINDSKNGEVRAVAHVLDRDSGIQSVALP